MFLDSVCEEEVQVQGVSPPDLSNNPDLRATATANNVYVWVRPVARVTPATPSTSAPAPTLPGGAPGASARHPRIEMTCPSHWTGARVTQFVEATFRAQGAKVFNVRMGPGSGGGPTTTASVKLDASIGFAAQAAVNAAMASHSSLADDAPHVRIWFRLVEGGASGPTPAPAPPAPRPKPRIEMTCPVTWTAAKVTQFVEHTFGSLGARVHRAVVKPAAPGWFYTTATLKLDAAMTEAAFSAVTSAMGRHRSPAADNPKVRIEFRVASDVEGSGTGLSTGSGTGGLQGVACGPGLTVEVAATATASATLVIAYRAGNEEGRDHVVAVVRNLERVSSTVAVVDKALATFIQRAAWSSLMGDLQACSGVDAVSYEALPAPLRIKVAGSTFGVQGALRWAGRAEQGRVGRGRAARECAVGWGRVRVG
jgi:hypothetical protein